VLRLYVSALDAGWHEYRHVARALTTVTAVQQFVLASTLLFNLYVVVQFSPFLHLKYSGA